MRHRHRYPDRGRLFAIAFILLFLAMLVLSIVVQPAHAVKQHNVIPAWPWLALSDCESGDGDGRPPYRPTWTHNGYFDGGFQFLPSTWNMAKVKPEVRAFAARYAYAYHAPAYVQYRVAKAWLGYTSWSQWPSCSRKLGLR